MQKLLTWSSPAYPVGGYTYSHGLETAVDHRLVRTADDLIAFADAVLRRGGGWVDAVLLAQAYRAANHADALDRSADLAAAFRATAETALESNQQGQAFLRVTKAAWPHPLIADFAARRGERPLSYATAFGLVSSAHGVPIEAALGAFLHATVANLVSAGVRLVPLGQTDGQRAIAALVPAILDVAKTALAADPDDLGTAAPALELLSMHHETLHTRLFRS